MVCQVFGPLLGIKWDCAHTLGRAFWTGSQFQGAALMSDKEAGTGVSECWGPRAALQTTDDTEALSQAEWS